MIQIDMPMPTNCIVCPACDEYLMCAIPINGRKWGENDVSDFSQCRPEWCPLKENEPQLVISEGQCKVELDYWARKGFCPKCHQVVLWMVNREYCGFCGQKVNWNGC